jgi:hypothetical protein
LIGLNIMRLLISAPWANPILTGQMAGQLNAAEADRIDARRRR